MKIPKNINELLDCTSDFSQPQPSVIGCFTIISKKELHVVFIFFIDSHNKQVVIRVCKWKFRIILGIISRVETKQGMKQLKNHKVMDP